MGGEDGDGNGRVGAKLYMHNKGSEKYSVDWSGPLRDGVRSIRDQNLWTRFFRITLKPNALLGFRILSCRVVSFAFRSQQPRKPNRQPTTVNSPNFIVDGGPQSTDG